jgi:hypothetical protein
MPDTTDQPNERRTRLHRSLQKVILLRETGPKRAAWHRARLSTIWRLHRLIETVESDTGEEPDADAPQRTT